MKKSFLNEWSFTRKSRISEPSNIRKLQPALLGLNIADNWSPSPSKHLTRLASFLLLFMVIFLFSGCQGGGTPLLNATKIGDVAAVRAELKVQKEQKQKLIKGNGFAKDKYRSFLRDRALSLDLAVTSSNPEIVELLLDSEIWQGQKASALHEAVTKGKWDIAKLFVDHGVMPNDTTIDVVLGGKEAKKYIHVLFNLQTGPILLMKAVELQDIELVEVLLEMGADVNYQEASELIELEVFSNGYSIDQKPDPRGMNALGRAIKLGNIDITRVLLEKGANPNVKLITYGTIQMPSFGGDRALYEKIAKTHKLILHEEEGKTCIMEGSKTTMLGFGSPSPVLLAMSGDQLSTPLIMAVHPTSFPFILVFPSEKIPSSKKLAMVKLLLDHGADVALTDQKGLTALMHAEEQKLTDIQELLKNSR